MEVIMNKKNTIIASILLLIFAQTAHGAKYAAYKNNDHLEKIKEYFKRKEVALPTDWTDWTKCNTDCTLKIQEMIKAYKTKNAPGSIGKAFGTVATWPGRGINYLAIKTGLKNAPIKNGLGNIKQAFTALSSKASEHNPERLALEHDIAKLEKKITTDQLILKCNNDNLELGKKREHIKDDIREILGTMLQQEKLISASEKEIKPKIRKLEAPQESGFFSAAWDKTKKWISQNTAITYFAAEPEKFPLPGVPIKDGSILPDVEGIKLEATTTITISTKKRA